MDRALSYADGPKGGRTGAAGRGRERPGGVVPCRGTVPVPPGQCRRPRAAGPVRRALVASRQHAAGRTTRNQPMTASTVA